MLPPPAPPSHPSIRFCTLIALHSCLRLMVQNLDVLNNVHAITLSLKLPSFVNWILTAQHTFSLLTVLIVRHWFETLAGFCLQLTTFGGRVHPYLTKQKKKDTGWSKKTVNCNFILTDLKMTKNGITQPFLERLHREVLIFWCLKRFRGKNLAFQSWAKMGGWL